jgi:5,10-methylene-tetrahydrofolate dehydrogenase/methenyl tetrahydrofolate cyclohydrolase
MELRDPSRDRDLRAAVTPVPGGVGPVTTMLLMSHVVTVAERGVS